jgi:3'-phosphoadenosine 5'-phosphosulfate sulfotransferase (PAPS reductase)/FAD synthetase
VLLQISTPKKQIESKAVFVFRKSAAQFKDSVCLFSSGKDSILLVYFTKNAFTSNSPSKAAQH